MIRRQYLPAAWSAGFTANIVLTLAALTATLVKVRPFAANGRTMAVVESSVLRFREYLLDPSTGELRSRNGSVVPLEPQPTKVLVELAKRSGSLVTREDLCRATWPDGTHVEFDQGLNYCIRQIRAALGDNARQPEFIETVARRGYRFLPPVEQGAPVGRRPIPMAVVATGVLVLALWIAERLEAPGHGRVHHDAVVGFLKTLHDLIF
jgi:DNA-binding winged helix-turn-helix (wHTH) protein